MCTLEWRGYEYDADKGFNHQMASIGCGMSEAATLNRTFILPRKLCIPHVHSGIWQRAECVDIETLFDTERLNLIANTTVDRSDMSSHLVSGKTDPAAWSCALYPRIHRHTKTFGFSLCLRRHVPRVVNAFGRSLHAMHILRSVTFWPS